MPENDEQLDQGFDTWLKKMDYLKAHSMASALKLAWLDGVRFGAKKVGEQVEKELVDSGFENPFADRAGTGNGEDKLPDPTSKCSECGLPANYICEGIVGSDFWCTTCHVGWCEET